MDRKRKREEMDEPHIHRRDYLGGDYKEHEQTPEKMLMVMDEAILKMQKFLHGPPNIAFTSEEYMKIFSCVSSLSSSRYFINYGSQLYEKFVGAIRDSIFSVVLPSLEGKEHFTLLTQIVEIWSRYKTMVDWLLRFFDPLQAYCSITKRIQLNDIAVNLICDWVFKPLWNNLRDEVIHLINLDRYGRVVDKDLLKAAIDLFVEIENIGCINYYKNFEQVLFANTAAYYRESAMDWFLTYSFGEYMKKALRCMRKEERRMKYYLPQTTMVNLLEDLRKEFMD